MTDTARLPVPLRTEIGSTGLTYSGHSVDEELLPELRGRRWQRVLKLMTEQDPTVGAILFAVDQMVRGVEWAVQPADESPEAEAVAAFVESCHPAGTLVRTAVTIGQGRLVGDALVPIESLRVGDRVVTHRGRGRRVTETKKRAYTGPLYAFTRAGSNIPVAATAEHPLFVRPRGKIRRRMEPTIRTVRADQHYEWRQASDVAVGDHLLEPIDTSVRDVADLDMRPFFNAYANARHAYRAFPASVAVTPNLMRLIGYFLAEGNVTMGGIAFTFHEDERAFHEDVIALVAECFGVRATARKMPGARAVRILVGSAPLRGFFTQFRRDGERWLPDWARQLPATKITQLMIGLLHGDAHFGRESITLTGRSAQFLDLIRRQFLRLGVVPSFSAKPARDRTKAHAVLMLSGSHARRFARLAGIEYGGDHRRRAWSRTFIANGYAHYPVRAVERSDVRDAPVYNVEVAGDHSYIANGIASHNCLHDMELTFADTVSEVLSFLPWGWAVFELAYKRRIGPTDAPLTDSEHEDGRIGWRRWAIRAQDSLDGWVFDERGVATAMIQVAPPRYRPVTIPLDRCLHFRASTRKNSPEGRSILRSAYLAWYNKIHIQRIEAIGIERDLAGIPVLTAPPNVLSPNAAGDDLATRQALQKIGENLRRDEQGYVLMPAAYDAEGHELYGIKLLTTGGARQVNTDAVIARYDARIAQSVLADFVLLGHEATGTYALATEKTRMFAQSLKGYVDGMAAEVNREVANLVRLNGWSHRLAPQLRAGPIEQPNLEMVQRFVVALVAAGIVRPSPELERYLLDLANLPAPVEMSGDVEDEGGEMDDRGEDATEG